MKLKVVFIGGLTNGKIVHDYLASNRFVNLELVITYPDNSTKPRHVIFSDNPNVIKTNSANDQYALIKDINPDFIFVAGWSELLSNEIIKVPRLGTIGFHPSKLPRDKGRSVLAWQIEDGYEETALSMFYYCDIPDAGDIIAQEKIFITHQDYINDVLNKIDKATYNLMYAYFPLLRQQRISAQKQDEKESSFRRLRKEIDDSIDWDCTSLEIYNKIRAISHPYPGAVFLNNNMEKCIAWKARIIDSFEFGSNLAPGKIVAKFFDDRLLIRTKDSFILIEQWQKVV